MNISTLFPYTTLFRSVHCSRGHKTNKKVEKSTIAGPNWVRSSRKKEKKKVKKRKRKRKRWIQTQPKYIIYFKYGWVGSGRVWRVCNFKTQTQPNLL